MFKVTEDIIYVGVNDHEVDLFEGQYDVPNGMAYNSYVVLDEKVAVACKSGGGFCGKNSGLLNRAAYGTRPCG